MKTWVRDQSPITITGKADLTWGKKEFNLLLQASTITN